MNKLEIKKYINKNNELNIFDIYKTLPNKYYINIYLETIPDKFLLVYSKEYIKIVAINNIIPNDDMDYINIDLLQDIYTINDVDTTEKRTAIVTDMKKKFIANIINNDAELYKFIILNFKRRIKKLSFLTTTFYNELQEILKENFKFNKTIINKILDNQIHTLFDKIIIDCSRKILFQSINHKYQKKLIYININFKIIIFKSLILKI
jgi:hypothetical protein